MSFWQLNLYCACMKIVILGFSTVVAPLARFPSNPNRQKFKLISFELKKAEITPYSELESGLEQALGHIQQLEAVVHSEPHSWLAAEAASQQI